jgi:hypothetical protein
VMEAQSAAAEGGEMRDRSELQRRCRSSDLR